MTGLIIGFAGSLAVVSSLQVIDERIFDQEPVGGATSPGSSSGWGSCSGFLIAEGVISRPVRTTAGPVVQRLLSFVGVTIFFGWTMHFLLAGRVTWRLLVRPAFVTALLWLGFALFSSIYFSPLVISDSKLYGTIGVVFSFLTWFIIIGAVIVLGAACGAVWQERKNRRARA